jgi:hypothetical protein
MRKSNQDLEEITCPNCEDTFTVFSIKSSGLDPYETDNGLPLCSAECYIKYLEETIKEMRAQQK